MKICDMRVGQVIAERLVLADCTLRKTKTQKDYLAVTFTDGSDTISGNIWNYKVSGELPAVHTVYDIAASIGEYSGNKQINISCMSVSENQDMSAFAIAYCSTTTADVLWSRVQELISSMQNSVLANIVADIYERYHTELFNTSSASGIHHCGLHGNLYHSLEVAQLANSICAVCISNDIEINRDLVVAGALLHDIGKIYVYDIDGAVINYTDDGLMYEHIYLGAHMLDDLRSKYDQAAYPCFDLLRHIILSHHGKLEYGSPVTPCFAEALIVNMADGISASLDTLATANSKAQAEGKDHTDVLRTLGNKQFMLQHTIAQTLFTACLAQAIDTKD